MMGLLVLLKSHKGSEDVALLADDLDLEIDEILPSLDYAAALQLVTVSDGRATFTDLGQRFASGTIRDRKAILRDQLVRTTLFKTLLRALERSPEHILSDDQLAQIVSFTTAPADEAVQNIINWGRYAELFRYDAETRRLIARRRPPSTRAPPVRPPPPGATEPPPGGPPRPTRASTPGAPPEAQTAAGLVASA
jgi:NitT/TauT family transport system ATP-binding protein